MATPSSSSSHHAALTKIPLLQRIASFSCDGPARARDFAAVSAPFRETLLHGYSKHIWERVLMIVPPNAAKINTAVAAAAASVAASVPADGNGTKKSSSSIQSPAQLKSWYFFHRVLRFGQADTIHALLEAVADKKSEVDIARLCKPLGHRGETAACNAAANTTSGAAAIEMLCHFIPDQLSTITDSCSNNKNKTIGGGGARVASVDFTGFSFFEYAIRSGNLDAVKVICGWCRDANKKKKKNKKKEEEKESHPNCASAGFSRGLCCIFPSAGSRRTEKVGLRFTSFVQTSDADGGYKSVRLRPEGGTWNYNSPSTLQVACDVRVSQICKQRHQRYRNTAHNDFGQNEAVIVGIVKEVVDLEREQHDGGGDAGLSTGMKVIAQTGGSGCNMLHFACRRQNFELIKFILEYDEDGAGGTTGSGDSSSSSSNNNRKNSQTTTTHASFATRETKAAMLNQVDATRRSPLSLLFIQPDFVVAPNRENKHFDEAGRYIWHHNRQIWRCQKIDPVFFASGDAAHAASTLCSIISYIKDTLPEILADLNGGRKSRQRWGDSLLHMATRSALGALDFALGRPEQHAQSSYSSVSSLQVAKEVTGDDNNNSNNGGAAAAAASSSSSSATPPAAKRSVKQQQRFSLAAYRDAAEYADAVCRCIELLLSEESLAARNQHNANIVAVAASYRAFYTSQANDEFLRRLFALVDKPSLSFSIGLKQRLLVTQASLSGWTTPKSIMTLSSGFSARRKKNFTAIGFTALEQCIFFASQGAGPAPVFKRILDFALGSAGMKPSEVLTSALRLEREHKRQQHPSSSSSSNSPVVITETTNLLFVALSHVPEVFATKFVIDIVLPMINALSAAAAAAASDGRNELPVDFSLEKLRRITLLPVSARGEAALFHFVDHWRLGHGGQLAEHAMEKFELLHSVSKDRLDLLFKPHNRCCGVTQPVLIAPLLLMCSSSSIQRTRPGRLLTWRMAQLMGKAQVMALSVSLADLEHIYGSLSAKHGSVTVTSQKKNFDVIDCMTWWSPTVNAAAARERLFGNRDPNETAI